jgi:hypothetical protein
MLTFCRPTTAALAGPTLVRLGDADHIANDGPEKPLTGSIARRKRPIGPLPVKFAVQGQYMPVHPDVFGQKWNRQFAVTPVIPKLIKGNLFDF